MYQSSQASSTQRYSTHDFMFSPTSSDIFPLLEGTLELKSGAQTISNRVPRVISAEDSREHRSECSNKNKFIPQLPESVNSTPASIISSISSSETNDCQKVNSGKAAFLYSLPTFPPQASNTSFLTKIPSSIRPGWARRSVSHHLKLSDPTPRVSLSRSLSSSPKSPVFHCRFEDLKSTRTSIPLVFQRNSTIVSRSKSNINIRPVKRSESYNAILGDSRNTHNPSKYHMAERSHSLELLDFEPLHSRNFRHRNNDSVRRRHTSLQREQPLHASKERPEGYHEEWTSSQCMYTAQRELEEQLPRKTARLPKSPSKKLTRAWRRVTEIRSSLQKTSVDSHIGHMSYPGEQSELNYTTAKSDLTKRHTKQRECVTWSGVDVPCTSKPQKRFRAIRSGNRLDSLLGLTQNGEKVRDEEKILASQRRSLPTESLSRISTANAHLSSDRVYLHNQMFEGCCNNVTGLPQGLGCWVDKHDETYAGEWFEGTPHGYGSYASLSRRCWFEGRFVNGQAHGFGKLLFVDETKSDRLYFYGEFKYGRYIHGSNPKSDRATAISSVIIARRASQCAYKQSWQVLQNLITNRVGTWVRRISDPGLPLFDNHVYSRHSATLNLKHFYWLASYVETRKGKSGLYLPIIVVSAVIARGGH
eukprot:CFRG5500T1